jgi:hypothetical protein
MSWQIDEFQRTDRCRINVHVIIELAEVDLSRFSEHNDEKLI